MDTLIQLSLSGLALGPFILSWLLVAPAYLSLYTGAALPMENSYQWALFS